MARCAGWGVRRHRICMRWAARVMRHTARVGSSGIRRRKPARHLPKLSDRDVSTGESPIPPVMWPANGSGFEPSNFSPAGGAQKQWLFLTAARHGYSRETRGIRWFGFCLLGVVLALTLVIQVLGLLK